MGRIISIHEYELKANTIESDFERSIIEAKKQGILQLPGLVDYYFVKGIRGFRNKKYAAIWIFEHREAWENLWGPVDHPRKKKDYPENWKIWEEKILTPYLICDPDKIVFTSYEEID
jgi:hypothetical protein